MPAEFPDGAALRSIRQLVQIKQLFGSILIVWMSRIVMCSAHKPFRRKTESHVTYIWQRHDWPNFVWNNDIVDSNAHAFALEASRLAGEVQHPCDAVAWCERPGRWWT